MPRVNSMKILRTFFREPINLTADTTCKVSHGEPDIAEHHGISRLYSPFNSKHFRKFGRKCNQYTNGKPYRQAQ